MMRWAARTWVAVTAIAFAGCWTLKPGTDLPDAGPPDAPASDAVACVPACPSGQVCLAGACYVRTTDGGTLDAPDVASDADTASDLTMASDAETDTGVDDGALHDVVSDSGIVCVAGMTPCGSMCTNTQTDNTNCGACGNVCGAGVPCVGGGCLQSGTGVGAPLVSDLGGPLGFGTDCLPSNDDGSWPADATGLDITHAFPSGLHFYSGTYTRGWINNNGSLSFTSALSTYTPHAFPGAPQPMIAPYWADVDTRSGSTCDGIGYPSGGGYPSGATCMNPATNGVWWSLTPGQMVVTWDQVGFDHCNASPVMTFQMILTAATSGAVGDFDIEFRYNQCGWEAGDPSGGTSGFCAPGTVGSSCTPAQVGYDAGDGIHYVSLPMSRTMAIQEVCTMTNISTPGARSGIWHFSIRGGTSGS